MRKIAAIGFAMIAFAATGLPALADDQPAQSPKYATARRAAQTQYGDYAQYNDARYGNYALSGDSGYAPWRCTYTGGPKSSIGWACQ
jgi:hypothetical protein